MAIKDMGDNVESKSGQTGDTGAIYHENLSLTSGVSDTYLLPISRIYAIACRQSLGVLSFTMDSAEVIVLGNEVWQAWDGLASINLAITAFKFAWTSGTAVAAVTIKTEKV